MLIRTDVNYELIPSFTLSTRDFEVLSILCNKTVISTVYRPPEGNLDTFFEFFESLLRFTNDNNLYLICGGDFNINMLLPSTPVKEFKLMLDTYSMYNVISSPTRVTPNSSTLIYLFITNYNASDVRAGVLSYGLSDHLPILLCARFQGKQKLPHRAITFQPILPSQLVQFHGDMSVVDWSDVLEISDPNAAYRLFLQTFTQLYTKHFPFKKFQSSKKKQKTLDK